MFAANYMQSQVIKGTVYEFLNAPPMARSFVEDENYTTVSDKLLENINIKLIAGLDRNNPDEKSKNYWEVETKTDKNGKFTLKPKTKLIEGELYYLVGNNDSYIIMNKTIKWKKDMKLDNMKIFMVKLRMK